MYLIVNADDYGYSDARDDGILHCYRQGAVTNVSLMVNGHSATRAVEKARAAGLPMGLHLNLTEGRPVSQTQHSSLVDDRGMFLGKMGLRETARLGHLDMQEVEVEIQGQISKFSHLTGSQPLSVDGHQHIHVVPGICEIFAKVLKQNNIGISRLPIETGLEAHVWGSVARRDFNLALVQHSIAARHVFNQHGIRAAGFVGLQTLGGDMTIGHLQSCILQAFKDSSTKPPHDLSVKPEIAGNCGTGSHVCELMVHPGKITGAEGGCGSGPDEFSQSPDREHEMEVLMSVEMKDFYKDNAIQLVAFQDCYI